MTQKILIVEDNADTRELLARLLEMESFCVVTAEDGRAGLHKASLERPDLILTDVSMPNLSGIEMIRMLRGQPGFQRLKIVTITAYGKTVADQALAAGADRALPKPFEFDLLIGDIKTLLSAAAEV